MIRFKPSDSDKTNSGAVRKVNPAIFIIHHSIIKEDKPHHLLYTQIKKPLGNFAEGLFSYHSIQSLIEDTFNHFLLTAFATASVATAADAIRTWIDFICHIKLLFLRIVQ